MLKIGDFSRLAGVTIKTLRHYAQIGLLAPAHIDRYTGYRYYALDQLPRLNRILALKDLGLTLEQVTRVLAGNLSADELRGMFHLKQAELQQKLTAEHLRLARVEARLRQIEHEGHLSLEAVAVRSLPKISTVVARSTAPDVEAVPMVQTRLLLLLRDWQVRAALPGPGSWLALNAGREFVERDVPVEVALVLDHLPPRSPDDPRITARLLPKMAQAAVLPHTTGPEDLAQAYTTLFGWTERNGYRPLGVPRELYLSDGAGAPQVIEVQLPIEPLTAYYSEKEFAMEPEIIEKGEFTVAGVLYQGKNENNDIGKMWGEQFDPRIGELTPVPGSPFYGVCWSEVGLPDGFFNYMAALEVAGTVNLPSGMTSKRIPAGKYAVFKHTGALDGLRKTYDYIYHVWMPKSGFKRAEQPDFEVYTDEFTDFAPDSILYLWVPIN